MLVACGAPTSLDAGHDPIDAADAAMSDSPTLPDAPPDVPVDAPFAVGVPFDVVLAPGEVARHPLVLTEGDWLYLGIRNAELTDPTLALTTLAGERVAYSEDFVQSDSGAVILTRIPATDTYVVETALEPGREGDGRFTLESALLMTNASFVIDAERGDDVRSATAFEPMGGWIAGRFDHPGDVDVFDLPDAYLTGAGVPVVGFDILPSGPTGNGATTPPANVRFVSSTGASIGEWTPTGDEQHLDLESVELPGGFFEVRGGDAPGANGFYVIRIFFSIRVP